MKRFPYAHATHPQWQMAAALVLAQLRAQMALPGHAATPTLGLLYVTDHYASAAAPLLEHLQAELPWVTDWAGTVGVGIVAHQVEYRDEPALAVMLLDVPADQYRVFSGIAPLNLGFEAHTALVHADGSAPELSELLQEMALRTDTGYLFGGLCSSRSAHVQFAVAGDGTISGHGASRGVFSGGLSGVAFGAGVELVSRVTQGCSPVSKVRRITRADHNVALELDGEPALDTMLGDLAISLEQPQHALDVVRATLVGLAPAQVAEPALAGDGRGIGAGVDGGAGAAVRQTGNFGDNVLVRHIIGLDPGRRGIAVAAPVEEGLQLVFCQRNAQAARADLLRICAEIREEVDTRPIAGALYISCTGRGGQHFGGPNAEMHIVRKGLGDVPLVGFFAAGEIARQHLYGYTGVLTVFVGMV